MSSLKKVQGLSLCFHRFGFHISTETGKLHVVQFSRSTPCPFGQLIYFSTPDSFCQYLFSKFFPRTFSLSAASAASLRPLCCPPSDGLFGHPSGRLTILTLLFPFVNYFFSFFGLFCLSRSILPSDREPDSYFLLIATIAAALFLCCRSDPGQNKSHIF